MIQLTYQLTNMNTTHIEVTGTEIFGGADLKEMLKELLTFYSLAKQPGVIRFLLVFNKLSGEARLSFLLNRLTHALPLTS